MRRVTITIEFLTDTDDEDIERMAAAAEVQILEPVDDDGNDAIFAVSNVRTTFIATAV